MLDLKHIDLKMVLMCQLNVSVSGHMQLKQTTAHYLDMVTTEPEVQCPFWREARQ